MNKYFRSGIFAAFFAIPVFVNAQGGPTAAKISPTDAPPASSEGSVGAITCPAGSMLLIQQPPNQSNGFFSDSDCATCGSGQQSIAENFVVAEATDVDQLTLWGGYSPNDQIPDPADAFTVIFHQDAGGLPGAVIDTQNVSPTSATLTGMTVAGVDMEVQYVVDLAPVALAAGTYWVEIFTNSVGNTDSFFWETGNLDAANGVAGHAFALETPGVTWVSNEGADVALGLCGFTPGQVRFLTTKDFDDGNTAEVEVTLSCNTGLPLEQTADISEGDPVNFVITDFEPGTLDCEITEVVPGGYTASYDDGTVSDVNCSYEDVRGGQFNCAITNALDQVEVEVTKEWIDENPQFNAQNVASATWSCSNVAFPCELGFFNGCDGGNLDFFGNPGEDSFLVFPDWESGTTCSITEVDLLESGIEVDDSDCQGLLLLPGEGASCTIVNTRLFEGIPTLSQYGLALLALLMLGMGFVAFRRVI